MNALGRMGKWREAVGVVDGMGEDGDGGGGGDRPDAFVYASAINACGKAGRPVEVSCCCCCCCCLALKNRLCIVLRRTHVLVLML